MLFAQSTGTITQTVNDRNTIGVLSATPNGTITAGNPIAFTYILNTAGAPAPTTETVQFYDGTTALGTPQTIALSPAANFLPYSQVNTGQGWTTSGTTPTVASLTANGPDGSTNTATALTFVNSTSTVLYAVPGTTNYANQQVTFSIWAESATPTTLNLIVQDSPFVAANKSAPCSVTSTWQRCTLTYTFPANAGTGFAVSLTSSNFGVPINLWGAQFEQAGQAGPYVSTIGTARPTGAQAGTVAFSWSQFQTGVHTVTVQYPGDANFVGSTSNAVVLTAQQEIPKIVLTDSPAGTSVYGQAVTLTAQLSDQDNDDDWIPTGTVRRSKRLFLRCSPKRKSWRASSQMRSRTGVPPTGLSLNVWLSGQTERTRMGYSACVIKCGGQHSPRRRRKPTYRRGRVCSSERSCSRPMYEILVPVTALSSSTNIMCAARNHAPRKRLIGPDKHATGLGQTE
jgi:hypothetical protein